MASFEDTVVSVTSRYVDPQAARRALGAVSGRAEAALAEGDQQRLAILLTQYVRALRALDVRKSAELERELLAALDISPPPEKTLEVKDAISLIALRNYVRYLTVATGMDWSEGMLLQSAVSDLAHSAQESGGGRFTFQMSRHELRCDAQIERLASFLDLDRFAAGVKQVAQNVSTARTNGMARVTFSVALGTTT